jgi:hypothetical protein
MLAECGCRYTLVGHSERRAIHGESDTLVAAKAQAALARGVTPIVCVGETLAQREAGETEAVVKRQLSAVIHQLAHCAGDGRSVGAGGSTAGLCRRQPVAARPQGAQARPRAGGQDRRGAP